MENSVSKLKNIKIIKTIKNIKKIKMTKEKIFFAMVILVSAVLNLVNLSIEGTGNTYYAAAVKSMTKSFKNFFFVSFDPTGFVTIDKPPLGYWLQAISATIFGFYGWSIMLPQALAGVASVAITYFLVKKSFGTIAGLISAFLLAITPVFVAASRNNTVDNVLLMFLLLACWALLVATEKGKFKYLIVSMVFVGLGFNVKMLQAYLVLPALYITYLLSTSDSIKVSIKKRLIYLLSATFVLVAVSLSWAIAVDLTPASSRPYVDSSTNNTVMELILGHNGIERLNLSNSGNRMGGGRTGPGMQGVGRRNVGNGQEMNVPGTDVQGSIQEDKNDQYMPQDGTGGQMPPMGDFEGQNGIRGIGGGANFPDPSNFFGMGGSNLPGTFGNQVQSGITRLFSKSILSDQIVWFLILSFLGFLCSAIKEKLGLKLDNVKKQSLILWFMWLFPAFIYFSFNNGTWHNYYLTMMAPPIAALSGIGLVSMWDMYKEGGKKAWFLPISLAANGVVHMLMLSYFKGVSVIITVLMAVLIVFGFGGSAVLAIFNILAIRKNCCSIVEGNLKIKQIFLCLAVGGLIATPLVGSAVVLIYPLNNSMPAAGLELLSSKQGREFNRMENRQNSGLIKYLQENKTTAQKYLLVVSSSNEAAEIILNTDESVMSLGGFLGSNNPLTLEQFKELAKRGEIRYVMVGGFAEHGGDQNQNYSQNSGNAPNNANMDNMINQGNKNNQTGQGNNRAFGGRNGFSGFGGFNGRRNNDEIMEWVKQNGRVVPESEYGENEGRGQLYDLKSYSDNPK